MKRIVVILVIVIGVIVGAIYLTRQVGLATVTPGKDHPLLKERFTIVAHRGGSLEAPENTLASFDHASKLDSRIWLELDVHFSADRRLVVIHDPTVDRTTDGTGKVVEQTLEQLKTLDAGAKFEGPDGTFPMKGKGVTIPTLEEVFARYPKSRIIVEVKSEDSDAVEATVKAIERAKMEKNVVLSSFQEGKIHEVQLQHPDWAYNISENEVRRKLMLTMLYLEPIARLTGDILMIPPKDGANDVLTPRLLAEAHRRHKKVFLWTINDEAQMREFMSGGVDGLITDAPSRLLDQAKAAARF